MPLATHKDIDAAINAAVAAAPAMAAIGAYERKMVLEKVSACMFKFSEFSREMKVKLTEESRVAIDVCSYSLVAGCGGTEKTC